MARWKPTIQDKQLMKKIMLIQLLYIFGQFWLDFLCWGLRHFWFIKKIFSCLQTNKTVLPIPDRDTNLCFLGSKRCIMPIILGKTSNSSGSVKFINKNSNVKQGSINSCIIWGKFNNCYDIKFLSILARRPQKVL